MAFDTSQALSIQAARTIDVGRGSGGGLVGDWLVHADRDYLSAFPMRLIYPRPDVETGTVAAHRVAHSQVPFAVDIDVNHGAWPYKYEIVNAPAGTTIGSEMTRRLDIPTGKTLHEPGADYGVVSCDFSGESQGSVHTFEILVTDQLGDTVTVQWTTTLDDSKFVFLSSVTGNDANTGTFSSPLQTFPNGLWKNDDLDATYAGKVAMFEGSFTVYADASNTSPILNQTRKPVSMIGYGSGATLNLDNGHFRTDSNVDDLCVKNISIRGSRSDLGNNRLFNFTNRVHRFNAHKVDVDNVTGGTAQTDNPAVYAFMSATGKHEYISIKRNNIGAGCESQLYVTFDTDYFSAQLNTGHAVNIISGNGSLALNCKDDTSYLCMRGNTIIGLAFESFLRIANQNTLPEQPTDQEISFNRLVFQGNQDVDGAIQINAASNTPDGLNIYVFRNNVVSQDRSYKLRGTVTFFSDAYSSVDASTFGDNPTQVGAPVSAALTPGDFDINGLLVGAARTANLGTIGSEIAGE